MKKKAELNKLVGLKIYCEKLDKEILVDINKCYFDGGESECELCGSHGHISVDVTCECGNSHTITIKDW
jgi:hypothetical protein